MLAAQLATVLLLWVGLLLWLEQRAQRRLRFAPARLDRQGSADAQPLRLKGGAQAMAWALCALPVLLGFALPVLILLQALASSEVAQPWDRFGQWAWHSLRLGGLTALLAVALALALAFTQRQRPSVLGRGVTQLVGVGYAIPGAVVVVGLLLPVGWLQQLWPASSAAAWITATSLGLVWAYLVRFGAVALQSEIGRAHV